MRSSIAINGSGRVIDVSCTRYYIINDHYIINFILNSIGKVTLNGAS